MNQEEWITLQSSRRRRGRIIPPCVTAGRTWKVLTVTTPYNKRSPIGQPWSLGRHTGEDHAAPTGSRACAVTWGRVICLANWTRPGVIGSRGEIEHWGDSYGTHVVIRTASGLWDYALCHLSQTMVRPGQRVRPGQVIGLTGHSGGSGTFGPHLHLEARPAGGRFGTDVPPILVKRMV